MPRRPPRRPSARAAAAAQALYAPHKPPPLGEIIARERLALAIEGPTAERLERGPVRRDDRQIEDGQGRISAPYRAVDTLMAMEANGTISWHMRTAGERFRDDFALAGLDALRAADMERAGMASQGPYIGLTVSQAATEAHNRVYDKLGRLGDPSSRAVSCAWHVLGMQRSLRQWAIENGYNREFASGVLVAVLDALAKKTA